MPTHPIDVLVEYMEDEYEQDAVVSNWSHSTFGHMRIMQLTSRGRVGERSLPEILEYFYAKDELVCETSYTNEALVPHHHSYDALLQWADLFEPDENGEVMLDRYSPNSYVKLEIKTATQGSAKNFQVNNIRLDDWDYLLLLAIQPEDATFALLSQEEVSNNCTLTNMASTADGNYKLTLKLNETSEIEDLGIQIHDMLESWNEW